MRRFDLVLPNSLDDCLKILAEHGPQAKLVAGGTDLLPQMKNGQLKPALVVDLSGISRIRQVQNSNGQGLRIGAAVTARELEVNPAVRGAYLSIAESAAMVGSLQVRNLATVGGNLCNAAPSADMAPPLIALEAQAVIAGPRGERRVPMADFFTGVRQTVLAPNELLVELIVPPPGAHSGGQYLRHTRARYCRRGRGFSAHHGRRPLHQGAHRAGLRGPDAGSRHRGRAVARRPGGDARGHRARGHAGDRGSQAHQRPARLHRVPQAPGPRPHPPHAHDRARPRERLIRRHIPVAKQVLSCTVNGEPVEVLVQPYITLLDALREDMGLTGPKEGCGTGDCGACTVHVDGKVVASCLMLAMQARGRKVRTIEGLAGTGALHPLQDAFVRHGVPQCGFCIPGVLMAAAALLDENPRPSEEEIRYGIAGNLCRCTGYTKMVAAISEAAGTLASQRSAR
jgi:xanthine dehydrogenase iron-sulfur cluster and FAD-binding subunit A